jgi:hypothetical protein
VLRAQSVVLLGAGSPIYETSTHIQRSGSRRRVVAKTGAESRPFDAPSVLT